MTASRIERTSAPTAPRRSFRLALTAAGVVLALVTAGIVWSKTRPRDTSPKPPSESPGVGAPATVDRANQSPGCDATTGADEVQPIMSILPFQGADRRYRLIAAAPASPGDPRPLIIDFTDIGETIDQHVAAARLDELAKELSAVIVTPESASPLPQWNVLGSPTDPDDLGFVRAVLTATTSQLCIDLARVTVIGKGAGAHMAATFACDATAAATGVVMVAGIYRPPSCPGEEGLSVVSILGTNDETYPAAGGLGPNFSLVVPAREMLWAGATYAPPAAEPVLELWASANGCSAAASRQVANLLVRVSSCRAGASIWRSTVAKDHEWYSETNALITDFIRR